MKKGIMLLMVMTILATSGCAKEESQAVHLQPIIQESSVEQSVVSVEVQKYDITDVENYMESVKEQSESIKAYLEHDAVTQMDLNEKSKELYDLWDGALNHLWSELKANLSEEKFAPLLDEQRSWITEKENAMKDAGKDFEGGSMYALVINSEGSNLTEERVYELYEILNQLAK